jgi:hypothetical protein
MRDWRNFQTWVVVMVIIVLSGWLILPAIAPLLLVIAIFNLIIIILRESKLKWEFVKWRIRSFYLAIPFFIVYLIFMVDFEMIEYIFAAIVIAFHAIVIAAHGSYK